MKKTIIYYIKIPNKKIKIIDIKNVVRLEDLPREYLTKTPRYFKYSGAVFIKGNPAVIMELKPGLIIDSCIFGYIVNIMKKAGKMLAKINRDKHSNRKPLQNNTRRLYI